MSKFLESCARRMMIATIGMVDYRASPPRKERKPKRIKKQKKTDVAINNVVIAPKAVIPDAGATDTDTEVKEGDS